MLTASFFCSLSGLILSAASVFFLLKDIKARCIYLIFDEEKTVIRRDKSPFLFKLVTEGIILCTAITFLTCLMVLMFKVANLYDFLKAAEHWQTILALIPYSLIFIYVLGHLSVKIANWWRPESEKTQTLGLSDKKDGVER
jgi:hypothetical protein